MQLQKIEIDFEIHKLIESERRGFEEAPYIALRRLLKLTQTSTTPNNTGVAIGEGTPFVEDSVTIPHGSLAKMKYQRGKQVYDGQFLNGKLVVNGQYFSSLSSAASAFSVTKKGNKTSLNGWQYWQVKFPNETKWRSLLTMRDEANL